MLWVPALLVGVLVLPWLQGWSPGQIPPNACYFRDALVPFVECKGTAADRFFSKALNFAFYWTIGFPTMAAFFPPLILPWLLSIFFAFRFLTSKLARPEVRRD